MNDIARTLVTAAATLLGATSAIAQTQTRYTKEDLCVSSFLVASSRQATALGIAAPEAERITREIITKTGTVNQPYVVPCGEIEQAEAYVIEDAAEWPADRVKITPGEYILYNPTWTRQVIGSNRAEAIVLFGHEIGHLINRDYTGGRKSLTVSRREKEADFVAGCVAARSGLKLEVVTGLLSRLRDDRGGDYPSRAESIGSATDGFAGCLSPVPITKDDPNNIKVLGSGYIYYEELQGFPTNSGVFRPLKLQNNPAYGNLQIGTVLRAVKTARFRKGPGSLSDIANPPKIDAGECVRITNNPSNPVSVVKASSGGHLQVELIDRCPGM